MTNDAVYGIIKIIKGGGGTSSKPKEYAMTKQQIEARKVFAKYCVRTEHFCAWAGAQKTSADGKQYVGNAYWVARYVEGVDGLETADFYRDYSKFIDEAKNAWKIPFLEDDIKPYPEDNKYCTIGDTPYNLDTIKKILKTFKKPYEIGVVGGSRYMGSGVNVLYLADTYGNDAIVVPLRELKPTK